MNMQRNTHPMKTTMRSYCAQLGVAACQTRRSKIMQELAGTWTGMAPGGWPRGPLWSAGKSVAPFARSVSTEPGTIQVLPQPTSRQSVR